MCVNMHVLCTHVDVYMCMFIHGCVSPAIAIVKKQRHSAKRKLIQTPRLVSSAGPTERNSALERKDLFQGWPEVR